MALEPRAGPHSAAPSSSGALSSNALATSSEQVAEDLRTTEHGFEGLDRRSPKTVDAIVQRFHAHPRVYVDAIRTNYISRPIRAEEKATLSLADILGELYLLETKRSRGMAADLIGMYAASLGENSPQAVGAALRAKMADLELIEGGMDAAAETGSRLATPDEVCPRLLPGRVRRPALVVRRECTCGETLSCRTSLANDTLNVELSAVSHSCTDCTRAFTACTLPKLAPATSYKIAVAPGPRVVGAFTTDHAGIFGETCLRVVPTGAGPAN